MSQARLLSFAAAALLLVSGLALAGGPGSSKQASGTTKVEGQVTRVEVSMNAVFITKRSGEVVGVTVNAATKIERNGARVPLSAIRVGDRGQAIYVTNTGVATKVESTGP